MLVYQHYYIIVQLDGALFRLHEGQLSSVVEDELSEILFTNLTLIICFEVEMTLTRRWNQE